MQLTFIGSMVVETIATNFVHSCPLEIDFLCSMEMRRGELERVAEHYSDKKSRNGMDGGVKLM